MSDYVLVGGGAFAREIADWFGPTIATAGDRLAGYLDDGPSPMAAFGYDLPHLGAIRDAPGEPSWRLVLALTGPADKQAVVERLGADRFAGLVHPSALVSGSARLGPGVVVAPFALVSAGAEVGAFATVNAYSSVGHDVRLGAFSTLSCHVDLTGRVRVGAGGFFGSGARVLPDVALGEGCRVGAGAVVVRDAPAGATLYAAPARRL
jgi:sugar O-acyltransferase (sialic acid O-acetyltransferase NeuD family)